MIDLLFIPQKVKSKSSESVLSVTSKYTGFFCETVKNYV